MENTILVVDARNRDLNCFVASATKLKTNNNAVVLRKAGGYVGSVNQLIGETIDFPILVVGSYQAKSSAGFTSQICRGVKFQKVIWVGGAGFGFSSYDEDTEKKVHKGYGLRPFCCPLSGTLIPKGAKICDVETHHNSNGSTANAARTSLGLMTKINPNLFILAEGQSDYVSATSFEVADTSTVSLNDFPDEHRADIFSGENMLDAGIRRMVGHNGNRIALRYALLNTVLSLGMRGYEANSFMATVPETVCEAVGHEQLKSIVQARYSQLLAEGWKFGFDMSLSNHYTKVVSPDGVETQDNALFLNQSVEECFLSATNAMATEDIHDFRCSEISKALSNYFWDRWDTAKSSHDFLIKAWFDGSNEATVLWFSDEFPGPENEPSHRGSFMSAWDDWSEKDHHWKFLRELTKMEVTAYTADGNGNAVESRVWTASESSSPYVNK